MTSALDDAREREDEAKAALRRLDAELAATADSALTPQQDQAWTDAANHLRRAQELRFAVEFGCNGCGKWWSLYQEECRISGALHLALVEADRELAAYREGIQRGAEAAVVSKGWYGEESGWGAGISGRLAIP